MTCTEKHKESETRMGPEHSGEVAARRRHKRTLKIHTYTNTTDNTPPEPQVNPPPSTLNLFHTHTIF